MNIGRLFPNPMTGLLILGLAMFGCSHEAAFQKQRAECKKVSIEGERTRCLQTVEADETEYQRKQNETRIEQSYKRKLEDMRPR